MLPDTERNDPAVNKLVVTLVAALAGPGIIVGYSWYSGLDTATPESSLQPEIHTSRSPK
jgi:hypothetical protein